MSEPFLGEIKIISWNFAPKGWAFCDGQLLPINQNQALFAVFGTTYGGNGQETFGLPNLQGRTPLHVGNGFVLGQAAGEQAVTLNVSQIPQHTHVTVASSAQATLSGASGNLWCAHSTDNPYSTTAGSAMAPSTISLIGGNQAHDNMSPYLVLNFIVALQGIFPTQN
jgi:microcystin-dependent protein